MKEELLKEVDSSTESNNVHENDLCKDNIDQSKPWWKANFLITEPALFGTWDGVFTSCMINIFGVIIFLRTGWMVGNAGLGMSVFIIILTSVIALLAVLSAVGVCERCNVESGGVYFLMSHVLGGKVGSSIGILYCFGQAVSCSLYLIGFGDSISLYFGLTNPWISRGIAVGVILLLLAINLAGVQWVIRLQLILLVVLFISVLDFIIGAIYKKNLDTGVVGFNINTLTNNTEPLYMENQSFFTVFGVFFPTATGVFAGINMSGDLRNPSKNIPTGTLTALGISFLGYLVFAVILGATCTREALQTNYLIASEVAAVGPLLLIGLYVSSLSSALGGVTGAPRVLQAIACTTNLPLMGSLGKGFGSNNIPVVSLIVLTIITLIFIIIGNINILGPIITMPFLLTYAAACYAYFALAMSFDMRREREEKYSILNDNENSGDEAKSQIGTTNSDDLDRLFPDRTLNKAGEKSPLIDNKCKQSQTKKEISLKISKQSRSWYSILTSRWLSFSGVFAFIILMFTVQWLYALVTMLVVLLLYFYISQANPGLFPGVAEFSLCAWITKGLYRIKYCVSRTPVPDEDVIVPSFTPNVPLSKRQINEENEDFSGRGRYHQSQKIEKSPDIEHDQR